MGSCIFFFALIFLIFSLALEVLLTRAKNIDSLEKEYLKTFRTRDKTAVDAHDYFTLESLYGRYYKHIKAVPSALVGVGILGTFFGLSLTLGSLDFSGDDPSEMMRRVQESLSSMKTAFYTSVGGMSGSLVLGLIERYVFSKKQKKLDERATELNKLHMVTQIDFLIALDGFENGVGKAIGDSMNVAIENVAAHLKESAGAFEKSSNMMNGVLQSLGIANSRMESLASKLKGDVPEINKMIDKLEDTISEFGDTAVQLAELKGSIGGLAQNIADFGNATSTQQKNIENTERLLGGLEENMKQMHNNIAEIPNMEPKIKEVFKAIEEGVQTYINLLQNQTSGLLGQYVKEFTKACESINSTTQGLKDATEDSSNRLMKTVESAAKKMEEATKRLNDEK